MKLTITELKRYDTQCHIYFELQNGLCALKGFDILKPDEVETLELELTDIVKQLYDYRTANSD
jgi:hypothetical protein